MTSEGTRRDDYDFADHWLQVGDAANVASKGSTSTCDGRLEEGAVSTHNLFAVCARGEGRR